jgi:methyl-accepting chemotaxis protein
MERTLEHAVESSAIPTGTTAASRARHGKKRHKRRQYLIDKGIQFSIMHQFMLLGLCAGGLTMANYLVFRNLADLQPVDVVESIMIYGYTAGLVLVSAILLTLMSVFLSHRIAGPAWHLSRSMSRVEDGELWVMVRLRKNDMLVDLARAFNRMMGQWRNTVIDLDRELGHLRRAASGNEDVLRSVRKIEKILAHYEVESPGQRSG